VQVIIEHDRAALLHGKAEEIGEVLAENTVDAIVTDPPAGIGFMAKNWDGDKGGRDQWVAWLAEQLAPAFRALKPGGHGLVWALPRTSHWTALALETVGFEIRDRVSHLFGTGFPKSLTSKSAEIPEGTGSALKPAAEDWWLVRKPLEGTYAENFAKHGTGVINIDECRIGVAGGGQTCPGGDACAHGQNGETSQTGGTKHSPSSGDAIGRWPSHVVLSHSEHCDVFADGFVGIMGCVDDCPVRLLDEQSGIQKDGVAVNRNRSPDKSRTKTPAQMMNSQNRARADQTFGAGGGASRFFYVAKGSRSEKDEGLDHLPVKNGGEATGREEGSAGTKNPRAGAGRTGGARNFHPTVKSVALMTWLVKLITPPGGTVLDVFAGSGTTGVAALACGRNFIGVEMGGDDGEYIPVIEGRLRHALNKIDKAGNNPA
jgi:DNA methylase